MKKIFAIALILLFIFVFLYYFFYYQSHQLKAAININGFKLNVVEAVTTQQKMKGLSGTQFLTENQGMLFLYPEENYLSFWMKDMLFPIDMIWLNKECHVVYIVAHAPPCLPNADCMIYTPNLPAQYVLETVAGFSKKHNINLGSTIKLAACREGKRSLL